MTKTVKETKPPKLSPGIVACDVEGCESPYGARNIGFTPKGLINHKTRKHATPVPSTLPIGMTENARAVETEALAMAVFSDGEAVFVDPGTPGDEVVMGQPLALDTNSLMQDVKKVVEADLPSGDYYTITGEDEAGEYVRGWRDRKAKKTVLNTQFTYDSATGWRIINGKRMKPCGKAVSTSIVEEADKRYPYLEGQPTDSAPVGSSSGKGPAEYVQIKTRDGKLYVKVEHWEEMSLERFFDLIRMSVKLS